MGDEAAGDEVGQSGRGDGARDDGRAESRRARRRKPRGEQQKPRRTNWLVEVLGVIVVAGILSFLLQNFVGHQWYVPSESMEPTLVGCAGCTGDRIVTEKLTYYTSDPKPGDVIVFKGPSDSWNIEGAPSPRSSNTVIRGAQEVLALVGLQPPNENDLVKRVIATGGQTIECQSGVGVTVNGKKIYEPYLAESAKQVSTQDPCWGHPFGPVTVPSGNVFVMGDNRLDSADSRYHMDDQYQGTIPKADIRGKVVAIVYPFSRWRIVHSIDPQV
ncbi:signal peptidase I [Tsukamurella soli]|uniref:signal peptidase I n=1 Tax=Tsukamurella soli TaxID=644556 RepID=UPI00360CA8B7